MTERVPANEIDDAATAWVARTERDVTLEEQAELEQWLAADSRHLGAFVRAQAAWIHAERATALGMMPEPEDNPEREIEHAAPSVEEHVPTRPGVSRRTVLAGGVLAASAAGAGLFVRDQSTMVESRLGEIRRLALGRGATLTLDTDTQVKLGDDLNDRRVELVRGRLFTDLLPHSGAPLSLKAAGLALTMIGGGLAIEALRDRPLNAIVTAGSVRVVQSGGLFGSTRTLLMMRGMMLTLAADARLSADHIRRIDPAQLDQLLSWRDGMIAFTGETLAMAANAFERYSAARIVVTDPDLASRRVTGLFKADDPHGFAMAIAASLGAVSIDRGDVIQIIRKKVPGG